jgi:hypothetical protein
MTTQQAAALRETRPLVIDADPGRLWDRLPLYTWPAFFASLRGYRASPSEIESDSRYGKSGGE